MAGSLPLFRISLPTQDMPIQECEMTFSFKDQQVLVTGGTSGIGLGIAQALAQAGAHIVVNGFGDPAPALTGPPLRRRAPRARRGRPAPPPPAGSRGRPPGASRGSRGGAGRPAGGDADSNELAGLKPWPMAAPAGGLLLIFGWLWLAVAACLPGGQYGPGKSA